MIDQLFEVAPVALGIFDSDRRWVRANKAMFVYTGRDPSTVIGFRPSEIFGEDIGGQMEERISRVLETGEAERFEGSAEIDPGVRRWWDTSWFPLKGGHVALAAIEITDRVNAELEVAEAHRNEAFLARAGHVLSTALTVQETADLIAHTVVPQLADWCFVELARDGRIDRVAWAHRDPSKTAWMAELDRRFPLDPASPVGSPKVIRTGELELVADLPDEWLVAAAQDEEHLRVLREIGFRSTVVVPLIARGRIIGDLAIATDRESGRTLGEEILPVVRALADRCALALDNAVLYAHRDLVAVTLQEELLPPRLPPIPGIDVAARYSAAGEGNQVGGDFYDIFASDGGWQVVIGDVVGKGPAAAAVTGLARHTMRAAATYEGAPSQLLRVLNDALLAERRGQRIASVACVRMDPADDGLKLTVSAGGHPLPLLVGTDGAVREVGRNGQLLGIEEDLVVFNSVDRLAPGELLVLFTDGVVEVRGESGVFGEDHLHALLADTAGQAPTRVLRRIESAVLAAAGGRPRDDVAMVALRPRPKGPVPSG